MFLMCHKGGQKGRSYFSFPISAHPVIPTSLALSLAHLSIEWSLAIQTFTNRLRMSKALCGVSKLAHEAELNINAFYRTRSTQGNPELNSPRFYRHAVHNPPAAQKRGLNHGSTGCAS